MVRPLFCLSTGALGCVCHSTFVAGGSVIHNVLCGVCRWCHWWCSPSYPVLKGVMRRRKQYLFEDCSCAPTQLSVGFWRLLYNHLTYCLWYHVATIQNIFNEECSLSSLRPAPPHGFHTGVSISSNLKVGTLISTQQVIYHLVWHVIFHLDV
jgi:hypothetical protein